MDPERLQELLVGVRAGEIEVSEALARLRRLPAQNLGHTRVDTHRSLRCGHPEVVFGSGKSPEQLLEIARAVLAAHDRLLVTRVAPEAALALCEALPAARHDALARTIAVIPEEEGVGQVVVASAGTSDGPVAREAAVTARALGAHVEELADVGVAGLHRLLEHEATLRAARVVVVVAGMEGALPSVVGGLVPCPVVAVPTSVGYGASFGGLAALLAMLNSCAAGVSVVNIDNGFGAGYSAALINRLQEVPRDMKTTPKAWLALENGVVMEGRSVGAPGEATGDLVFNTAMTGYHEILTDPSYCGQVVLMTYPLIGNYGVAGEDAESGRAWAEAFVMREMSARSSNRRATTTLPEWLVGHDVVAIDGIDTRRLTKMIRNEGCLRCIVSTLDADEASLVEKARKARSTDGRDLASVVSCDKPYAWDAAYDESYPTLLTGTPTRRHRCVAYDFGAKRNIMRSLVHTGFDVTVVPAGTPADQVLAMDPQAIFLSNGPGDPSAVKGGIDAVSDLVGKLPIFGICLGHQILSIVLGAKTAKMPFGHHGANHPVRDLQTGKVEITSQNHSFAVEADSLPAEVELGHLNLNDQTVEGMRHSKLPVFSVQYHPEAAPGPLDSSHLFVRFHEMVSAQG